MNRRLLFIYNPKAGKAQIKNHLFKIIDIFAKTGYEVTVHPTQYSGDATDTVAAQGERYDLIVCCGGDGTLDEVVAGCQRVKKRLPIGYIPAGSTNDFARSIGIPIKMSDAAKVAVSGQVFPIDIGLFNEKTFVYVAAFGVFADVTYQTEQELKNAIGYAAYILEGMKLLPSIKSHHMIVECLEGRRIEDDFVLGMVTNSLSVGGFSNLTDPKTELDDGVFEVLLIKLPQNPIEFNSVIASLLNRDFTSPLLVSIKTAKVKIMSDETISWTLDGEFGGQTNEVEIVNLNRAVDIVVP